jgi:hypothetical protein
MDTVKNEDANRIGNLLSEIRDLYGTLKEMTKRFLDDFSIPRLNELVRERALVLLKIDSEEERLLRIAEAGSLKRYGEYGEITDTIAAILSFDREIAARVTRVMNTVRGELSSLSESSNAAKVYTRHCRR